MAKRSGNSKSNNKRNPHATEPDPVVPFHQPPAKTPLEARTETQKRYINAIKSFDLVYGLGPAGTGKTYVASSLAAEALSSKKIERIILTRPAVDAGESLGFLPGELEEKFEPYLRPFRDALIERMGKGPMEYAIKAGRIEPIPLAYMRGMTFKNCWVLLDEAQNVTPKEMKMFLTRIGENCKVIVSGDLDQPDIAGPSGLRDAVDRTKWIPNCKVISFKLEDVVRSGLCLDILKSYSQEFQPILV
jgi:phosphate starvation-inducible PhoH-like protein